MRSLQKLGKHRYIVCLHQVIRSKTKGDFLNLVFDYHPSNLYKEIKKARNGKAFFSHERVITWTFELLSAVAHAHKNGKYTTLSYRFVSIGYKYMYGISIHMHMVYVCI